jgi:hypothetical protein
MVYGLWVIVYGLWFMCMVYDSWFMVYGLWFVKLSEAARVFECGTHKTVTARFWPWLPAHQPADPLIDRLRAARGRAFLRPLWRPPSNSLHETELILLHGEDGTGDNFWCVAIVGNLRPLLKMRGKWT